MSDVVIRIEDLSKQYHIGARQQMHDSLSAQLASIFVAPFRRAGKLLRGHAAGAAELDETIWALKDVSAEINRGEVVGVIGRNGAGKSTILKILSAITEPTKGHVDIKGRVGSLLEVGTGFHTELTGRENVFLNGAILGMKKAEIERKFDEIVAFADIDKFIDTPVKHYSSGMTVRLAFSVAAHLEPEILLVDEVLAVGDVEFQNKCLGKMGDVVNQGRTVLFVSHNMGVMQTLCQRGIFLQDGMVAADGPISEVVDAYLQTLGELASQDLAERERTHKRAVGQVKLVGLEINQGDGDSLPYVLKTGGPARFVFQLDGLIKGMSCMFAIVNQFGQLVTNFSSAIPGPADTCDSEIGTRFICEFDELLLMPGRYHVNVLLRGGSEWQDYVEAAAVFDVQEGLLQGRPVKPSNKISVSMPHRWTLPA